MARPEQFPVKKLIGFDDDLIGRVEDWRRKQALIPTFSDAVRALLGAGLDAEARRYAAAEAQQRRQGATNDGSVVED